MLTLKQYREINALNDGGLFDKMIHIISVVSGVDEYDVQNWDGDKIVKHYQKHEATTNISERYSTSITIEGVELKLMNFEALTLGQWIDLESMVSESYIDNIHKMSAIIYLKHEGGGIYSDKWEDYDNVNVENRALLIDDLPAQSVLGACVKYLKFRKNLFASYEMFDDPFKDVNPDELDSEELEIFNEEQKQREQSAGNQWSNLLNLLTSNDGSKWDYWLGANLFLALNQASTLKASA